MDSHATLIAELVAVRRQRDELLKVARRYEAWEADLIMCQKAWRGGLADLPTLTQELWDELLVIQRERNAAVKLTKEGSNGTHTNNHS